MLLKFGKYGPLVILAMVVLSVSISAQDDVVELEFAVPSVSDSDLAGSLKSVVKVQNSGGWCQNGLYLMTHIGDRDDLFERENKSMIDNPLVERTWRFCSVFSMTDRENVMMGRNWDNENVGSIIISLYHPTNGYSSVSFSRSIDLGYPLHIDLEGIAGSDLGKKLLLAPLYAYDGMNEFGLAIGIAGSGSETVGFVDGKQKMFVPFLARKILDQTKTIDEAVALAERYVPFDLDENSLNSHIFVTDASGKSVVLEYAEDQWRMTYGDRSWQVMSTKPVYNVPDSVMRENCWRYRGISESLEHTTEDRDFRTCMGILEDASQQGTSWSVVYSPTMKDLYFSVYQQWETVYHLKLSGAE